jgi:hypothetical protein
VSYERGGSKLLPQHHHDDLFFRLFVSSRVKAERDSKKLAELGNASKSVNACTAEVVAAVKSGQQSLSDESECHCTGCKEPKEQYFF